MEDAKIIDLFWARNEDAIAETDAAYGRKLRFLANKILNNFEDAEESVSDTYMKTWEVILKCTPCQGHFNSEGWKNLRPHDMILLYHPRRIVQR